MCSNVKDGVRKNLLPYPYRYVLTNGEMNSKSLCLYSSNNSGVSPLLHTWWPRHVRALLYKRGNIEGEVLHRLIYLDVVLPSCGRPDPVVVFL